MTKKLINTYYEIFTEKRPYQHYCQRGHYSNAGAFLNKNMFIHKIKNPAPKSGVFFMNND